MATHAEREQKRSEFHVLARRLCGQRIVQVRNVAIAYEGGEPYWDHETAHSPEFGVDLLFEDGKTLGITWGWEFTQYTLSFTTAPLQQEIHDPGIWDVSESKGWRPLLGRKIEEVILYWYRFENEDPAKSEPRDMEIVFEDGAWVTITSAEYDFEKDPPLNLCDDNITVFFDEAVAKRCEVGRYQRASYRIAGLTVVVRPERLCSLNKDDKEKE